MPADGPKILIVADAPGLVATMREALEGKGYQVTTARDGEAGLAAAQADAPDCVITDVLMPGMDGWTLIQRLRATRAHLFTPVLFLTGMESAEQRVKGFRLGADDYLPKPVHPEELEIRVARALEKRKRVETAVKRHTTSLKGPDGAGLRGSLTDLALSSLLTLLEMERKSGLLAISRDDLHETGRIFVRDGRVVQSRVDGRPALANAEAVFYLLTWTSGRFIFRPRDVAGDDEVKSATPRLLMEGTRRLDESGRHPRTTG